MCILLKSNRLNVIIAKPGAVPNTTTRFDRAGFITSIILDGRHQFCMREPDNLPHPCSGGYGLCCEYKFEQAYYETKINDRFPKLGVGLLLKSDGEPYRFFQSYNCLPYNTEYDCSNQNEVVFLTRPNIHNGYGVEQKKSISVYENILTQSVSLLNAGEKAIEFDEYCHNFVTLDRLPLGPDYSLLLPAVTVPDKSSSPDGQILLEGDSTVAFPGYLRTASIMSVKSDMIRSDIPFSWELSNRRSPLSVTETVSFMPSAAVIWAIDHIISVEAMNHVLLQPGQRFEWQREWCFCNACSCAQ